MVGLCEAFNALMSFMVLDRLALLVSATLPNGNAPTVMHCGALECAPLTPGFGGPEGGV